MTTDNGQKWWKGNLHAHSFWSDADDFPESVAAWFRDNGYDFLSLTDHNILSDSERWVPLSFIEERFGRGPFEKYVQRFGEQHVETRRGPQGTEVRLRRLDELRAMFEQPGRFILIQGEEISAGFRGIPIHINGINLRELIPPVQGESVCDVMQRNMRLVEEQSARRGGDMITHMNHPNFGWAITAEDLAEIRTGNFFEIYNGHPIVWQTGDEHHPPVERMWDIANSIRMTQRNLPPLYGLANDDCHNYHGEGMKVAMPGRGWNCVRAPELSADSLLAAMRRGDFYASTGVVLEDVQFDRASGRLELRIWPQPGASFTTRFIGTRRGADLSSEPAKDADGNEIRATRRYSDEIGRTFATAEGLNPSCRLTGGELYVRALVTSSRPHPRPSFHGQMEQAWTQPVMPG